METIDFTPEQALGFWVAFKDEFDYSFSPLTMVMVITMCDSIHKQYC